MSVFLRKTEQKVTNVTQTIAPNTHSRGTPLTSFLVAIKKIYPEEGVCSVESEILGDDAYVFYNQNAGVREGAAAVVDMSQGTPIITRIVDFGTKDSAILDPLGKEDGSSNDVKFFWKKKAEAHGNYRALNGFSSGIHHKDSEKVFACDFSGLKAGINASVLFYEANSKFICTDGQASVIADNVTLLSRGGSFNILEPKKGKKEGYSIRTNHVLENKDSTRFYENVIEITGNVNEGLSKTGLSFEELPGDPKSNPEKSVYLMAILDVDPSKTSTTTEIVEHKYIHRKLIIKGNSNSKRKINKKLLDISGIDKNSNSIMKNKAIIAKLGDKDVAVVYLKFVTRDGDIYEFNAGERITVSNSKKEFIIEKEKKFNFGKKKLYLQDDFETWHYPVSENPVKYEELYYNIFSERKMNEYIHNYRVLRHTLINSNKIYEIDASSGIKTLEFVDSPIKIEKRSFLKSFFEKSDKLGISSPMRTAEFKNSRGDMIDEITKPGMGLEFIHQTSSSGKKSYFAYGTDGMYTKNNGFSYIKTKMLSVDSDFNFIEGPTSIGELFVDGSLYVKSSNIYLQADQTVYMKGRNIISYSDGSIDLLFNKNFVASYNKPVKKGETAGMVFINNKTAFITSDEVIGYGGKDIYMFADKYGAFGAKKAVFFGQQQ